MQTHTFPPIKRRNPCRAGKVHTGKAPTHRVPRPKEREQAHWLSQPRVCSNWCRAAVHRRGGEEGGGQGTSVVSIEYGASSHST